MIRMRASAASMTPNLNKSRERGTVASAPCRCLTAWARQHRVTPAPRDHAAVGSQATLQTSSASATLPTRTPGPSTE